MTTTLVIGASLAVGFWFGFWVRSRRFVLNPLPESERWDDDYGPAWVTFGPGHVVIRSHSNVLTPGEAREYAHALSIAAACAEAK